MFLHSGVALASLSAAVGAAALRQERLRGEYCGKQRPEVDATRLDRCSDVAMAAILFRLSRVMGCHKRGQEAGCTVHTMAHSACVPYIGYVTAVPDSRDDCVLTLM